LPKAPCRVKIAGITQEPNMADTTLFPFELKDGTIINCKSADDRQLLEEARLVAEDTDDAKNFDKDRLLKKIAY
jgi:hypothetical protein